MLGGAEFDLPKKLDDVTGLLLTLIAGSIWYYLGVRDRTNRDAVEQINKNLVVRMRQIIQTNPNNTKLTWVDVDRLFYYYVDKDASLTRQSHMAYWNGAFWSFAADLRAAAALGLVVYVVIILAGQVGWLQYSPSRWFGALTATIVLFVISIQLSRTSTRKQIEIGDRQIRAMVLMYRDELRPKLEAIANALP